MFSHGYYQSISFNCFHPSYDELSKEWKECSFTKKKEKGSRENGGCPACCGLVMHWAWLGGSRCSQSRRAVGFGVPAAGPQHFGFSFSSHSLRKLNEPYVKDFALKQKIFNALGLSVVAAVGVENAVVSSGLDDAVVSLGKQGGLFIHGFGVLAKWQQQDAVVRAARWDVLMCPGPQMGPCSANPLPSVSCPTDLHPCWADIPQATGFSRPPACCELKPQNEALLAGFPAVLCSAASLNPSELLSGMETLTFWENVD